MRKYFAILVAFFVLLMGTNCIFAADSDYKNNLLKIELTKTDEGTYDVGLYTQKIYNEPVKVIKKSDTLYYLLLPETSHSITSVSPLDAITNVMVKLYPYAGQDLKNGYTRVTISTAKPVMLTTSLRTLDSSVSPRLDPMRLARLDKVFERYSERLAQNNIPTPLAEFRKTAASQRPALQSTIAVKKNEEVIASAPSATNANSFEEYQNKQNELQAASKQAAKQAQTSAKKPAATTAQKPAATAQKPVVAQKPAATQQPIVKTIVQQKPLVTVQKPAVAQKPATVQKPVATASKPAATQKTVTVTQKPAATTQKPVVAQKPATTVQRPAATASKPAATTAQKPVTVAQKPVSVTPKASEPVQKPVATASKPAATQKPIVVEQKPVTVAQKPVSVTPKTTVQTQPSQTTPVKVEKPVVAAKAPEPVKVEPTKTEPQEVVLAYDETNKRAEEYEKMLPTTTPVDAEFGKKVPVDIEASKNIEAEVIEPIDSQTEAEAVAEPEGALPPVQAADKKKEDNTTLLLVSFLSILLVYVLYKKYQAKKQSQIAQNNSTLAPQGLEKSFKEKLLYKRQTRNTEEAQTPVNEEQQSAVQQETQYSESAAATRSFDERIAQQAPEILRAEQTEQIYPSEAPVDIMSYERNDIEEEAYVQDELQYVEEPQAVAYEDVRDDITSLRTEDDEVIQQLYTPITANAPQYDIYSSENDEIAVYNEEETLSVQQPITQEQKQEVQEEDPDAATIVSSSKLTETRGLYLAKFEGSTSLVGYIQDDIYVLYNFGDSEIKETDIESQLAQENDTDSLYIVKTGGKKLMVKSTPYDLSLEMVM